MKRIYYFLIIAASLLALTQNSFGQKDSSGVYKSGRDFKEGKLYLAIDCRTEKHKIKLNDFFGKPFITVVHKDSSYKLYKSQIFGYKTCDGQIIRFLNKKELVLINPTESILIYKNDVARPPKGSLTNVTNYYFSKDAESPVLSLTISNLKKTFPENHVFHEKLDALFKYNTELAAYDDFHKMYKVNWIFQMSNK